MTDLAAQSATIIRRPPAEVFHALITPDRLREFWLRDASAPLAAGATVTWHFLVPGASETLRVTALEPNARIGFDWSDGVRVEFNLQPYGPSGTHLSVKAEGFATAEDAIGATEGFSLVLCDLKTLLECGRSANLVRDKAELIVREIESRDG